MKQTATNLRAHLYEMLDRVVKTGEPIEVERGGVQLCIVRKEQVRGTPKRTPKALPNLIVGDPDDLIHMEWPWSEGSDL